MLVYVNYASGRTFGGENVPDYRAQVSCDERGVRIEFSYPYQGQRYQRANGDQGVWSETAIRASVFMRSPEAVAWLAEALTEAAKAITNATQFEVSSPPFSERPPHR